MVDVAALLDPPTHARRIRLAHLHGRNLKQREIDRFRELGIRALDLGSPWPVLVDKDVFTNEYFSFADDLGVAGELAFTFAVISNTGMIDIAAWQPETNRMAVWCGEGFALRRRWNYAPRSITGVRSHPAARISAAWRSSSCAIMCRPPGNARRAAIAPLSRKQRRELCAPHHHERRIL